jgi:hypothetical protein
VASIRPPDRTDEAVRIDGDPDAREDEKEGQKLHREFFPCT